MLLTAFIVLVCLVTLLPAFFRLLAEISAALFMLAVIISLACAVAFLAGLP